MLQIDSSNRLEYSFKKSVLILEKKSFKLKVTQLIFQLIEKMKIFTCLTKKYHALAKIQCDWSKLTPKQKWQFLYDVGNGAGYLIGVRFLGDATINWYSFMVAFVVGLYYTLAAYTIIFCAMDDRIFDGLSCLCMSGAYTSVSIADKCSY